MKQPTHRPHGMGRLPVEWPEVPRVAAYRVRAIDEWLTTRRNKRRAYKVTGPFLAIVCALKVKNYPLPTRRALAEALSETASLFSIDAAISTALANGEITEDYRQEPGDVEKRASVRKRRYLLPSPALLAAYTSARR